MKTKFFTALTSTAVLTLIGCGTASTKIETQEMLPVTAGIRNSESIVDVVNESLVSERQCAGNSVCPYNEECINSTDCRNNDVCSNHGECLNNGECINDGICVNGNQIHKGHGKGKNRS